MKLKVIASGSSGNSYLMYNDTECLIIELGVKFGIIKQSLNFNLKNIVGALVSHEHKDHCIGVKDALLSGIDCYMSPGTKEALNLEHHRLKTISHGQKIILGGFEIMAFDVKHDCAEPLGFLIRHADSGQTVFITDSFYCPYVFPGTKHIIIEANYCDNIIKEREISGSLHPFLKDRTVKSHMSIKTCLQFLAENDLTNVLNIMLIHLSDSNSNAASFKNQVEKQTGKIVNVAEKGLVINLGKNPF